MLSGSSPAAVPDRDNLPLKKREQRRNSPPPPPPLRRNHGEAATFKAPYPRGSCPGPLRPSPKRVPPLHQPWVQASAPTGPTGPTGPWADWREPGPPRPPRLGWERGHCLQHPGLLSPLIHAGRRPPGSSSASGVTGEWEQLWRRSYGGGPHPKRSGNPDGDPPRLFRTYVSAGAASPPPPDRLPWLLPHFLAGSLIELRDGRLRRVEHLQTEDFLLGAPACPDLRLSCCTVQSITPSASSSTSRLLVLLHEQQSQELVEVYVEYPFFVQDRGWSSCSPQRTAHLCGLRCRQLSVGDVCLALTPLSAPRRPPRAAPAGSEEASGQDPPGPGRRKELVRRRRHRSAPELRGPRSQVPGRLVEAAPVGSQTSTSSMFQR